MQEAGGRGTAAGRLFPAAIIGCILVILVPMPSGLMDVLIAANFLLAALLLIATISVRTPLELSVFPSLLLAVTLFRLVLNVASTRLILTRAGTVGTAAAGRMIEQFGELVTGNRLIVGCVIFAIIAVIQFIVITKGAARVSEVAARFVLDSLPGRQMAIDAELAAGVIDESTARWQRQELIRQADFFGAMDGAAKFVRGDAVAGVIITLVNIIGGLYVGVVESRMSVGEAADLFTRLTIGDGLASQVPAFLVALAAGLLVTRSTVPTQLGEQAIGQLVRHPDSLLLAALLAVLLALGRFPALPLLAMAAGCVTVSLLLHRRQETPQAKAGTGEQKEKQPAEAPIEQYLHVEPVAIELGYGLLHVAEGPNGLIGRLQRLRYAIAERWGLILPKVRVRDNLQLGPRDYLIKLRGRAVGRGTVPPDRFLAVEPDTAPAAPLGVAADPDSFGPHSRWIRADMRGQARRHGYKVLDGAEAILFHFERLVGLYASELLSRDHVSQLLERLKSSAPALVEELVPGQFSVGQVHRVLQSLLREGRSIRDLETILEALGDRAGCGDDVATLSEHVRRRLDQLFIPAAATLKHAQRDKRAARATA